MTGAYLPACDEFSSYYSGKFFRRAVHRNMSSVTAAVADLQGLGERTLGLLRVRQGFFLEAFIRTDGNLVLALILAAFHTGMMPPFPLQQRSTQP